MRNCPQLAEQVFQFLVAKEQRITAAQQDISHGGRTANVLDLPIEFGMEVIAARVAYQAGARAVTTVRGAAIRHQKEHTIRIPMDQAGDRRVIVFATRIGHFPSCGMGLFNAWNDLASNWAVFIARINQVKKVRRDGHRQFRIGQQCATAFFGRECRQKSIELLKT